MGRLRVRVMSTVVDGIPKSITKRNGQTEEFNEHKIYQAIFKAFNDCGVSESSAQLVFAFTMKLLKERDNEPTVEQIQDVIEYAMMKKGFYKPMKSFILYREKKREEREQKALLLDKKPEELTSLEKKLPFNSVKVIASRYLQRDDKGKVSETIEQLFQRVALTAVIPDIIYHEKWFKKYDRQRNDNAKQSYNCNSGLNIDIEKSEWKEDSIFKNFNKYHWQTFNRVYDYVLEHNQITKSDIGIVIDIVRNDELTKFFNEKYQAYYDLMANRIFMPNTPTLMNAGASLQQLSACFVLPFPDDLDGIMETVKRAAKIFKTSGGVGVNGSDIRPEGDIVSSSQGVASGPTSFLKIIDATTEQIKGGGKRRGANMGILEYWHPDIQKFVDAKLVIDPTKKEGRVLENYNVSVGLDEKFWQHIKDNTDIELTNPRTKEVTGKLNARQLMNQIAFNAWKSAEPGLLFLDNANEDNPLIDIKGRCRTTNPCGEQFLYDNESCNLGSINVVSFVQNNEFNWVEYSLAIENATRFLDNVIDANRYPDEDIDFESKQVRRIGLGLMGIADAMYMLEIQYDSQEGYEFMHKLASALYETSMTTSIKLAQERGAYPLAPEGQMIRNSFRTTIAPTGTISMIANCSNGIEPVFALAFEKKVRDNKYIYTNEIFEKKLKQMGIFSEQLAKKVMENGGSCQGIDEIPEYIQKVFRTAMDIHPIDHVYAQSVFQKFIDNSISKTINMPANATVEDVKACYILAWIWGCNGITVYRNGSRGEQVLNVQGNSNVEYRISDFVFNELSKMDLNNEYFKEALNGYMRQIFIYNTPLNHYIPPISLIDDISSSSKMIWPTEISPIECDHSQRVYQEKCWHCPCGASGCS